MTLSEYIEQHSSPESDVLQQITRSTHLEVINPRMSSGHVQGRVLSMISQMIQPQRILELGTFTGYSALCLAEGLTEDGQLLTICGIHIFRCHCRNSFSFIIKNKILRKLFT